MPLMAIKTAVPRSGCTMTNPIGKSIIIKEVKIDNSQNWRKIHWKSLESSYRSSPYFEFYEDDLIAFYKTSNENLYNLNLNSVKLVLKWLELDYVNSTTDFNLEKYNNSITIKKIDSKEIKDTQNFKYTQTFEEKNGFINGLSILDMIFNCGPKTKDYIKAGL